jgi:hypothetical protein
MLSSNVEKLVALVTAATVFAVVNSYGTLMGESGIWQGRALGVTAHPNHLGHQAALFAIICLCVSKFAHGMWLSILWTTIAILLVALCFASGSRSSWLVLAVGISGIALVYRSWPVVTITALSGVVWLVLEKYGHALGFVTAAGHFDRGNTRAEIIDTLLAHIDEAPLCGVGASEATATSNAVLSAWAYYGVVAVAVLILTYAIAECIAVKWYPSRSVFRIVATVVPAIAVSAVFEGQALDRYSPMLFIQGLVLSFYVVYSPTDVATERSYTGNSSVQGC